MKVEVLKEEMKNYLKEIKEKTSKKKWRKSTNPIKIVKKSKAGETDR